MEDTIGDFWRMVSELSISTIVMISEVKLEYDAISFWPLTTESFTWNFLSDWRRAAQMSAVLGWRWNRIRSHSCQIHAERIVSVLHTPRIQCYQFQNQRHNKSDTIPIQRMANGRRWSAGSNAWHAGAGRSGTIGAQQHQFRSVGTDCCSLQVSAKQHFRIEINQLRHHSNIFIRSSHGTDRSSIFVTLCILVQQLRLEKKVDCCTVVRKLRSQRSQFLNSYVSQIAMTAVNCQI